MLVNGNLTFALAYIAQKIQSSFRVGLGRGVEIVLVPGSHLGICIAVETDRRAIGARADIVQPFEYHIARDHKHLQPYTHIFDPLFHLL